MKVPCAECGAEILSTTAERNGGLCVPCSRGDTTTCLVCGARTLRAARGVELGDLCSRCRVEQEKQRPTRIREFVGASPNCSLLVALFDFDAELRRESLGTPGLGLLDPPERYESNATPKNAIAFAQTGGEDVHFSLLAVNGVVSDESPVVMTVPSASDRSFDCNFLLGMSLREFLTLGCEWGFDHLEQLAYDWDETVSDLERPYDGEELDEDDLRGLALLRSRLDLQPWSEVRSRLLELEGSKRFVLRFENSAERFN